MWKEEEGKKAKRPETVTHEAVRNDDYLIQQRKTNLASLPMPWPISSTESQEDISIVVDIVLFLFLLSFFISCTCEPDFPTCQGLIDSYRYKVDT